jgi:hypothetical protein
VKYSREGGMVGREIWVADRDEIQRKIGGRERCVAKIDGWWREMSGMERWAERDVMQKEMCRKRCMAEIDGQRDGQREMYGRKRWVAVWFG